MNLSKDTLSAAKILHNTFLVLLEKIGSRLLSFLLTIYIARSIGTGEFGRFAFAMSFASLFLFISEPGITSLTLRELSASIDNTPPEGVRNYIQLMSRMKLFLSVLSLVIVMLFSLIMETSPSSSQTRFLIWIAAMCLLFESMGSFWGTVFQARQRMGFLPLGSVVEKLSVAIVFFLMLQFRTLSGAMLAIVAFSFGGLVYLLFNYLVAKRLLPPLYDIKAKLALSPSDFSTCWRWFKKALPFGAVSLIMMLYYNIDIVMLGKMKGDVMAGLYGVSYKLFFTISVLSGAFLTAIFPVMSRIYGGADAQALKQEMLTGFYEKSFKFLFGFGLPLAVGGFMLSDRIISFLYGVDYAGAIPSFRIFSVVIIFAFINGLAGYYLASTDKQSLTLKVLLVTTGLNVILNFILIPYYDTVGAAIATLISEVVFFALMQFSIIKIINITKFLPAFLKGLLSVIIMGVFLHIAGSLGFIFNQLLVMVVLGGVIYLSLIWITGYLDEKDKKTILLMLTGDKM